MTIAIIAVVVLIFVVAIISRLAKGAGGGLASSSMTNQTPVPLTGDDHGRIVELLSNGKKIDAIKLYRDATHHGLKEAKQAVEAIERQS